MKKEIIHATTVSNLEMTSSSHEEHAMLESAITQALELDKRSLCDGAQAIIIIQANSNANYPSAVFDSSYRLYVYATRGSSGSNYLREIYSNGGRYFDISDWSLSAQKEKVGTFYDLLFIGPPLNSTNVEDLTSSLYGEGIRVRSSAAPAVGDLLMLSQGVWVDNVLVGVVGIDVRMEEIKDKLDSMRESESFPMVYSGNGETIYHPMQSEYQKTYLTNTGRDISVYEGFFDSFNTSLRPAMLSTSGSRVVTIFRPIPKGDSQRAGLLKKKTLTHYAWTSISLTPYRIAMVMAADDLHKLHQEIPRRCETSLDYYVYTDHVESNSEKINQDDFAKINKTYDVININNCALNGTNFADPNCTSHPKQYPIGAYTLDAYSYHLPVGCYKNPAVARQFTYDSTATYHLRHFLNSYYNSSNEVFPSISDKCKLDSRLATEWTAHTIGLDHNNTLFMYWGSANGLMVTYPGINFDISFDNRFRPWYYTATALGADTLAVSTPYLDALGAGLIVSLIRAVYHHYDLNKRIAGVLGYDFTYGTFAKDMLLKTNCSLANVQDHLSTDLKPMCFIFDQSGLLIIHSDFLISQSQAQALQYAVSDFGSWPVNNVFLGSKEPPLAQALEDVGFFVRKSELNEDLTERIHFFETNETMFGSNGILSGTIMPTPECEWQGNWKLSKLSGLNLHLLSVDQYQRGNITKCPKVQAAATEKLGIAKCTPLLERGAAWCSLRQLSGVLKLPPDEENIRDWTTMAYICLVLIPILAVVAYFVVKRRGDDWATLITSLTTESTSVAAKVVSGLVDLGTDCVAYLIIVNDPALHLYVVPYSLFLVLGGFFTLVEIFYGILTLRSLLCKVDDKYQVAEEASELKHAMLVMKNGGVIDVREKKSLQFILKTARQNIRLELLSVSAILSRDVPLIVINIMILQGGSSSILLLLTLLVNCVVVGTLNKSWFVLVTSIDTLHRILTVIQEIRTVKSNMKMDTKDPESRLKHNGREMLDLKILNEHVQNRTVDRKRSDSTRTLIDNVICNSTREFRLSRISKSDQNVGSMAMSNNLIQSNQSSSNVIQGMTFGKDNGSSMTNNRNAHARSTSGANSKQNIPVLNNIPKPVASVSSQSTIPSSMVNGNPSPTPRAKQAGLNDKKGSQNRESKVLMPRPTLGGPTNSVGGQLDMNMAGLPMSSNQADTPTAPAQIKGEDTSSVGSPFTENSDRLAPTWEAKDGTGVAPDNRDADRGRRLSRVLEDSKT
ncbi:hypothetical protein AAMO2058_000613100 [Amorphochlora amoebiformis]|mmetsp:Transcript_28566/g.45506  ORF Transcript_28566/g.45506 Transcript_28566/m.45506 type:complete len:1240 (-) Transcript_28566:529-4248(-)